MIQRIYIIENLDCANCAAKIESKMNALPEVEAASITFATRQLRITAEDPDALLDKLTAIARSVEHDAEIHPRTDTRHHHHDHHEHHEGCSCGHHHEHHEEYGCSHHHEHHEDCGCGHNHHEHHEHHHEHSHGDSDGNVIALGAGLFVAGLLLGAAGASLFSTAAFIAAYVVLGKEIITAAWKNLRNGHVLDENFLMSVASLGAFCIGEAAEAVGVMLFYRVGEYFEEKAVARSRSQIMEAVDLRPEVVMLENGTTIAAEDAKVGDVLIVRAGDRIPLDGFVLRGESRIDTAPITGEPVPVAVGPGDSVTSGCINTSGQLTIQVTHPLSESMVTRILNSVENAAASKPKIDRFITRFARVYTPIVVALAALVAIVPSILTGNWNYWVYTALSFLVMSCPCALVLSVPLAFFSGIGLGSKKKILFKGGLSIEALNNVKAVVMDKTGTITEGNFRLQNLFPEGSLSEEELLRICASCEQNSSHPIAHSIVAAAQERGIQLDAPSTLKEIAGHGISAQMSQGQILCGNQKLMDLHHISIPQTLESSGAEVFVAINGIYAGCLLISDTIKSDASDAISRLNTMGLHTVMLTGDSEASANVVAGKTGIHEVHAKLLPQDKLSILQQIRSKKGSVLFVGDGINDAPVLAGADVGAAMGSGADAAIEAADAVFMNTSVNAIPDAIQIARRTYRIAIQNVVFALAIKLTVMILGLLGFANMWMAVFADSGVAMLCVLNSIRILYKK